MPRPALVAVGERMVPRDTAGQNGDLVVEIGIEVVVTEACARSMDCGVGKILPTRAAQRRCR
jgi:hypothetical protein